MDSEPDLFPDIQFDAPPAPPDDEPFGYEPEDPFDAIAEALAADPVGALQAAERAITNNPTDGTYLILAAMAAIRQEDPKTAHRYLKRLRKKYEPSRTQAAVHAIALAQENRWPVARQLLQKQQINSREVPYIFPHAITTWAVSWFRRIEQWTPRATSGGKRTKQRRQPKPKRTHKTPAVEPGPAPAQDEMQDLPHFTPTVTLNLSLPAPEAFMCLDDEPEGSPANFLLRHDLARLALFRGFDELLCIPHLNNVEHYWYQIETARKVLKQFRGRVLLADEVGLGKTVEAGMALKEYSLRGMADRILILVPPSLVGQWQDEMQSKFGMAFETTHASLLRRAPAAFWSQDRLIASLATARLPRHTKHLAQHEFDLVIVDEAHHLKNRSTRNWKLVDTLKKRFLLLLSATPVQNSLVELYNLLTLLKPGLFKTEKDFRAAYMKPRHPRIPLNRDHLQALMRDVMIRNTRALVDVRMPPREVMTLRVDPTPDEADAYRALSTYIRDIQAEEATHHRLALHHLLQAAGSSPAAAAASLRRIADRHGGDDLEQLYARYAAVSQTAKVAALLDLLARNADEKKLVFVRHRETLAILRNTLTGRGIPFACFEGGMSGPQKDQAVERFRTEATVLLCTESGGEGRNLQFCNTLINFDLHWNPQRIEQRIGRIHRIGQERDVFVFNLALRHTVEERILTILDEKINMFELIVGEVQSILGEMDDKQDFSELVFSAWRHATDEQRDAAFNRIGDSLLEARERHEAVKTYDDELFGEEFEVV